MRVLLVNPPRSPRNAILEAASDRARPFVHRRLVGPPLGLLTVAATLGDHEVSLLELKGEYDLHPEAPPPAELLRREVERFGPQVVGVTFVASEHPAGMDLLRAAKALDPEVLTVAGGLHAQLCPEDFDDPAVDVLVTAQAPQVLRDLLEALAPGGDPDSVGGLRRRSPEGRLVPSRAPWPAHDLAGRDFVVPDRSLVEPWLETYRVAGGAGPVTYLWTALGCPHRCSFCSIWPAFGGAVHRREVDGVVAELEGLDPRYEVVRFADANSVVDLRHAERLFERIEAAGLRREYVMDLRVDTAAEAPRLVERMARAGLKVVICGFESFRDDELRRYGKGLEARRIREAIEVFHANGVMVRGNYLVPPDYRAEDFEALGAFAAEHSVALSGYTVLTPMPGTPLHRQMASRIVDRDLSKYNFFNAVLETALGAEEFHRRVAELWRIRLGDRVL